VSLYIFVNQIKLALLNLTIKNIMKNCICLFFFVCLYSNLVKAQLHSIQGVVVDSVMLFRQQL